MSISYKVLGIDEDSELYKLSYELINKAYQSYEINKKSVVAILGYRETALVGEDKNEKLGNKLNHLVVAETKDKSDVCICYSNYEITRDDSIIWLSVSLADALVRDYDYLLNNIEPGSRLRGIFRGILSVYFTIKLLRETDYSLAARAESILAENINNILEYENSNTNKAILIEDSIAVEVALSKDINILWGTSSPLISLAFEMQEYLDTALDKIENKEELSLEDCEKFAIIHSKLCNKVNSILSENK